MCITNNPTRVVGAKTSGMLDCIQIKPMLCDTMMRDTKEQREDVNLLEAENGEDDDDDEEDKEVLEKMSDEGKKQIVITLCPRAKGTFYNSILKGLKLWKRPLHDHCNRCANYSVVNDRITELTVALNHESSHPEREKFKGIIQRAGGRFQAETEKKQLEHTILDLLLHVAWKNHARKYAKTRQETENHQAHLQLDYGGFTDSGGRKVSAWSATIIRKGYPQEHVDFFFDAANQAQTAGQRGAKKNGKTGIFFLAELLSKERDPKGEGKSLMERICPGVTHLILSGDTGNGYRAYEMLQELSNVFPKYGYSVELIPLGPGHAWNRTDARIAHLNTFFNNHKSKTRLYGARGYAKCLHEASDSTKTNIRKLMHRSYVFFREVVPIQDDEGKGDLGEQLYHPDFERKGGHTGVRGLLYFNFSFFKDDKLQYMPGYARVRVFGDPEEPDNPTYVYSWCKSLSRLMCQTCSDVKGYPVQLDVSGCTKKRCKIKGDKEDEAVGARAHQPALPVERELLANEVSQPKPPEPPRRAGQKRKHVQNSNKLPLAKDIHQFVRDQRAKGKGFEDYEIAIGNSS